MKKEVVQKKDDILNIIFAFTRRGNNVTSYVKRDQIMGALKSFEFFSDIYPALNEYDYPDLSTAAIKSNRHVEYITAGDDIAFKMSTKEANNIIKRNPLVNAILLVTSEINQINHDINSLTDGTINFSYSDPNKEYYLEKYDGGMESFFDRLYTDGNVEITEDEFDHTTVNVSEAYYAIVVSTENKDRMTGVVYANDLHPMIELKYIQEARDIYREQTLGTYAKKSDLVRVKRRN